METIGTGVTNVNIKIQIGSVWTKDFIFRDYVRSTDTYSDTDLTGATFSFFLKRNIGDRLKAINLTLGNGIVFVTYYDNVIRVLISASQTSIEEGEYYFELRRTDLNVAAVSGLAYLTYDAQ